MHSIFSTESFNVLITILTLLPYGYNNCPSLFSIGSFALGPWGALLLFIGNVDISYIAVDTKRKGLL